jgi:hypothetical protein
MLKNLLNLQNRSYKPNLGDYPIIGIYFTPWICGEGLQGNKKPATEAAGFLP